MRERLGLVAFSIICFLLLVMIATSTIAMDKIVVIEFKMHPGIDASQCAKPPNIINLAQEVEFPKVLNKGWVSLVNYTFDGKRKLYPCMQTVRVRFPNMTEFYKFISESDGMIQYPFYSGADYAFIASILEYVERKGDERAYKILMLKDTRNSASESLAPLYSILRKNPRVFGRVFASLNKEQKQIAAQTQYDFNHQVEEQVIRVNEEMSSTEKRGVLEFNDLIGEWAKKEGKKVQK